MATPFGQVHPHSISSFSVAVDVQVEHEFCIENGCVVGDDMYLLAGQQPYRAVLLPRALNALLEPVIDNHLPPHNVRLNPLL